VLLVVALLPTLLSTEPGRGLVLSRVNKRLNGRLTVGGWSLGWFSPIRVREMRLSDAAGEPVVEVKRIVVPRGLTAFLGSRYDLGEVSVDSARVRVALHSDGTTNLGRLAAGREARKRPTPRETVPEPLDIDVRGRITLQDGEVTIAPEGQKPFVMRGVNMTATVEGLNEPIRLEQTARLGENGAPLSVTASVRAFENGRLVPRKIEAEAAVSLEDFDLESLSGLMAFYHVPLQLGGRLSAKQEAKLSGPDVISARGEMTIASLQVSGTALKGDSLHLESLRTSHDLAREGDLVTINDLRLDSPLAQLQAQGAMTVPKEGALPTGSLKAEGRLALAALAAQLPRTLNLRKDVSITGGEAVFKSAVTAEGGTHRVEADLRVEDLAGARGDRRFALAEPITLALRGSLEDERPGIEELRLTSSFCTLTGHGDLERFHLNLDADLGAATAEAAKFLDLGGRSAAGRADLALTISAGQAGRDIAAEMTLTDLALRGFMSRDVQAPPLHLTLSAVAPGTGVHVPREVRNARLAIEAPFLKAQCSADRIAPASGLPAVSGASVDLQTELDGLVAFARQLAPMPEGIGITGNATITTDAAVSDGTVTADGFEVALSSLDIDINGKHFRDRRVSITGSAAVRPGQRSLTVRDVDVIFGPGKVTVAKADVPDWSRVPEGASAETEGTLDAAALLVAASDFFRLPEGSRVAGKVNFSFAARVKERRQHVETRVAVTDLDAEFPPLPPIVEQRTELTATGVADPAHETLQLDKVTLASKPVNLVAAATLTGWATRPGLRAEGTHEIDMERVTPYLGALTGQTLALAGRRGEPFSVSMRLDQPDWRAMLREMRLETALHLSRASYRGLVLEDAEIPLGVDRGIASARVRGRALKGRVDLPVTLDVRDGAGVLSVTERVTLFEGLTLTDELARELISLISPIFRDSVVVAGRVGYVSERFQLPLDGDWQKGLDVKGVLVLEDVMLASSGFVQSLFGLMGTEPVAISLPDQRVAIAMRDGRIEQGPLVLRLHDYAVRISGVFTPQGAVDMLAEVPVTPGMLRRFFGSEGIFKAVKGEVLRIPIGGTISVPIYAERLVRENLLRLVRSAIRLGRFGVEEGLDRLLGRDRDEESRPTEEGAEPREPEPKESPKKRKGENILREGLRRIFE